MYLAGDVGGTKTAIAIYDSSNHKLIAEKKFLSKQFQSLQDILREFLKEVKLSVSKASFGVAGPIRNGKSVTPNLPWKIDIEDLRSTLNTQNIAMINDLEANAYGVLMLSEEDVYYLNRGEVSQKGHKAIVSAGTGLGEAGIRYHENKYVPFPSEAGHCDFFVRDDVDVQLFHFLKKKHQDHISMERVLSGPGLENLYHFFADVAKEKKTLKVQNEGESLAALISEKALKKECPLCEKALELFVSFYGAEAGNTALRFLALGGVYIGGGIAPKILEELKKPLFMKAFTCKGRLSSLLANVPVMVILNEKTALLGAAYHARHYL